MGMRTLNYQWGAPRPEVLHRGLSKIGDNNYRFHVPANFEASVQNAWFSQLENLPVSIRAAERDLAEIDFNSMPTFQNCTSQYYLNSPLSAKQMSFVAEFKKGKFSELKDFKPEPATSAEKTRKLCVIEELKKSTPPAVDFKLIAGK